MGPSSANGIVRNLVPVTGIAVTLLGACATHYMVADLVKGLADLGYNGRPRFTFVLDGTLWIGSTTLFVCGLFLRALFLLPDRVGKSLLSSLGLVALVVYAAFWTFVIGDVANIISTTELYYAQQEHWESEVTRMQRKQNLP